MTGIYQPAKPAITDSINQLNTLNLQTDDYTWSNVTATGPQPADTRFTLTAKPTAPYTDSVDITYKRLDLATVAAHLPTVLRLPQIDSVANVFSALSRYYGVNLDTADVTITSGLVSGSFQTATLVLQAIDGNLNWFGSVSLSIQRGNVSLPDQTVETVVEAFYYPSTFKDKPFAEFYSYPYDFTSQQALLSTYADVATGGTPLTPDFQSVADALTAITGDTWVKSGTAAFTLQDASIIYHGVTQLTGVDRANTQYARVMKIALGVPELGTLSGVLYLHYGLPGFA